jgi:hypothetical protein
MLCETSPTHPGHLCGIKPTHSRQYVYLWTIELCNVLCVEVLFYSYLFIWPSVRRGACAGPAIVGTRASRSDGDVGKGTPPSRIRGLSSFAWFVDMVD